MGIYNPKKILVPVDFSLMSKEVLRAGIEIGKHRDAEVCALHVIRGMEHIAYYAGEYSGAVDEKMDEESRVFAESRLGEMLRDLSAGAKVRQSLTIRSSRRGKWRCALLRRTTVSTKRILTVSPPCSLRTAFLNPSRTPC